MEKDEGVVYKFLNGSTLNSPKKLRELTLEYLGDGNGLSNFIIRLTGDEEDLWLDELICGERLVLRQKNFDSPLEAVEIVGKSQLPFNLIPDLWFSFQRLEHLRNRMSSYYELQRLYGADFDGDSLCAVVFVKSLY